MRRRVRATPTRALKASHIPEPSARALCSVLRARELAGRGPRGAGGAVRGGETDLCLAGRPDHHLTPGCGCVCAAAVRVCFACALCLPPERDILLKAADDEAAAMIEETKASRQREYDDVVAKSVRRRPRPSPPLNSPSATPASGLHPTLAEADRVSGWGRSNPATPRRPRRWRAPCSSRSPNFCPRRSRTSAHPSATQLFQALLLFLGRCFANVREQGKDEVVIC